MVAWKQYLKSFASFFELSLAPRIRAEVTSAWEKRIVKDDRWKGTSSSGVKIEGFISPNRTAYPIYEKQGN